jgi:hypothetical protein
MAVDIAVDREMRELRRLVGFSSRRRCRPWVGFAMEAASEIARTLAAEGVCGDVDQSSTIVDGTVRLHRRMITLA